MVSTIASQTARITGSARSRTIQCLTTSKAGLSFDEDLAKKQDAEERPPGDDRRNPPRAETPADPSSADDDDRLSTIPEGDEGAEMMLEGWARELKTELGPLPDYEDLCSIPV